MVPFSDTAWLLRTMPNILAFLIIRDIAIECPRQPLSHLISDNLFCSENPLHPSSREPLWVTIAAFQLLPYPS